MHSVVATTDDLLLPEYFAGIFHVSSRDYGVLFVARSWIRQSGIHLIASQISSRLEAWSFLISQELPVLDHTLMKLTLGSVWL